MLPQIKSLVWIVGGKQSRFHQILGVIQSLSGGDGCDWSLSNMVTLVWSKLAFSHHSTHSRCHCGGGKGLNFDLRSLWRKLIGDLDWLVIENQEMFRTRLFSCHPERLNRRLQSLQFVISEVPRLHRRRGVRSRKILAREILYKRVVRLLLGLSRQPRLLPQCPDY